MFSLMVMALGSEDGDTNDSSDYGTDFGVQLQCTLSSIYQRSQLAVPVTWVVHPVAVQ